jgi:hypothetical protein
MPSMVRVISLTFVFIYFIDAAGKESMQRQETGHRAQSPEARKR